MWKTGFLTLLLLAPTFISLVAALDFQEWRLLYGKVYKTIEEEKKREQVFYDNVKLVNQLNEDHLEKEITFIVNEFADLTPEEFKNKYLMPSRSASAVNRKPYTSFTLPEDVPDTFDWRDKNVVTSVKNQGSVGSCWAFSTVGNIEGQWALQGHDLVSLSAEQLVDCDATADPDNLHQDCGVFGGWPYLAYEYIMNAGGIMSESSYPYCSGMGTCFPCPPSGWNKTRCGPPVPWCNSTDSCSYKLDKSRFVPGLKIKDWIAIDKSESALMAALLQQGPLSVCINAELLQFYHSGVWDPIFKCDPSALDHAILLVGYGTEKGWFTEKPYWLIKNSWGEKWGMDGYFKLIRGKDKCGIQQQVSSAILMQQP